MVEHAYVELPTGERFFFKMRELNMTRRHRDVPFQVYGQQSPRMLYNGPPICEGGFTISEEAMAFMQKSQVFSLMVPMPKQGETLQLGPIEDWQRGPQEEDGFLRVYFCTDKFEKVPGCIIPTTKTKTRITVTNRQMAGVLTQHY